MFSMLHINYSRYEKYFIINDSSWRDNYYASILYNQT